METTATSPTTPTRAAKLGPEPTAQARKRRKRITIAAVAGGIVMMAISALATIALAAGPPEGTLRFEWSLGARYGLDANNDGIVDNHDGVTDLAGDKAFIQNPTYNLNFDTCSSPAVTERGSLVTGFSVTLSGPESKTVNVDTCKINVQVSKLGSYTAKVEIKTGPMVVDSRIETITPKDLLVVSVGDSVASGEGNPDTVEADALWVPKWQNEQCHRTSLAGPAQAALRMERRDPHTSVTFVHLACSGASITKGLVGDYEGQDPKKGTMLKPQLDQMRDLVGNRPVDALTVSIGANDAEFSAPVKACLMMAKCYEDHVPGQKNAKELFDEKAPLIAEHYPLLDARLDKMAKQQAGDARLAGKVFITQYMDVTKDDDGSYCTGLTQKEKDAGKLPGQTTNVDGLTADEMSWADSYVQDGLNTRVKQSIDTANANGGSQWVWVDGIKPLFGKHGYCAQDRWIRTLFESGLYQRNPDGAFHPNAEGHLYAYANKIEDALVPALGIGGTKAPLEFDAAGPLGDSINSWLAQLDKAGGLDKLTNALPFGAREQVQTFLRDKFFGKFLPWVQDKVTKTGNSITALSEMLDDPDGDGNPGVDAFGIANLDLDITGDIQPKIPTAKQFDITLTIKGGIAIDPDLALKAGEIGLTGQKADGKAGFSQTVKLHVDLTKPLGSPGRIKILGDGLDGHIKVDLAADFGGTDGAANGPDKPALSFTYGGLGLKAVGPAALNVDLQYGIHDPNGDGVIDATELSKPLDFVTASCVSGAVNVDLKASASLYGLTSKLGGVSMKDTDLCDGFAAPVVNLDDFGQFQGVTMVELVNGLAQLTASLRSIQQSADIDIPFVKEGLADVVNASDKLVKFFVDNGLTDPDNPMANITFDPTKRPDLDTIDEILPKLAQALGVPIETLNPRVLDGRLVLDLGLSYKPGPQSTGTLDFGDQLTRTGLAEVTGTTKATIDPSLAVNLGLGIDLRKDLAFADRFFLQLNGAGPELSADAKVTADAQLKATLSLLGVDLADDNASGPVTLLDRKDPTKPMLSIDLDGKGDDRLTLSELNTPSTTAQSPIKPTLNAKVPTFGLVATAKLGGAPIATGKVTIGWADLTALTGANSLQVTVDGDFTKTLLPFAFDPNNPRATITQLLTATHTGVSNLRKLLTTNPELIKALPLSGKRAADIDPMLAKLEGKLAELIEIDENLTLEQVETKIESTIGEALAIANDKWGSIVTLGYTPQTDTTNAAVTATIDLGLCTTDRAALPGCSKTNAPLTAPLNFALGNGEDSLAAVSSGGQVTISYDARLKMGLGVELPRVTAGTTAGSLPTVSGAPKLFVLDTSSFELGVGAKVGGTFSATLGPVQATIGTAAKPASAQIAARYALKSPTADPAAPKRMYVGGTFDTWLASLAPKQPVAIHDTTATKTTCSPAADACATLPVTVNGAYLGDLGFSAPDLLTPSGWTFDTATVVASLKSDTVQYALLVGGVRSFVERLEATLRKMPAGTTIPLLGTDPTAGANVLADFRTGVLDPMQDLANQLTAANNAAAVRTKIQDFLFAQVGPAGTVPLLRDGADAGTDVTKGDITVILKCKSGTTISDCADGDAATKIEDLQIRLPLAKTAEATSKPFTSGFPGLRLSSDSGFSAGVGFEMDLAFGIDRTNGFYIPVAAFGSAPELRVAATASMPNRIDANIALIPASITDLTPGQPDVAASVGVDLAGGGSDGKVTLANLGSVEITPTVSACANVQLGLVTGGDKKFPSFKADLKMSGGLNCAAGGVTGAPAATSFAIGFDNVRVNAGSVINDFVAPAAKTIRKYTGPLEGTIDALREPIPGIAEAARGAGKKAPTWMDLLEAINKIRMAAGEGDQLATVKKVIFVSDLVRSLGNGTGTYGDIALGDFDLSVAKATQASSAGSIDGLLTNITESGGATPILSRLKAAGVDVQLADKLQPTAPYQSLTFPAFERPQRLFELLLGKDVPLVRFEAGGSFLHVPVGPYAFPVGPATVYFGGALDLSGHFAAGFDTYGIRQAYSKLTSDNPEDRKFASVAAGLLGGFYLDDYDASGKDVPEILAQAEVVVGAGVGIPGFGVFAEGGVHANAAIDLKTTDGKMRPEQVIAQLRKNPNPVCLFDASAKIDAFVRVNVSTPIKDIHFPIADVTVLDEPDLTDFCNTQQEPDKAKVTGLLHSDGTLEVFTSADSDRITVTQLETAGTVDVVSAKGEETFEGVSKVFVDGAAGDDTITVTSVTPSPGTIPVHLCGGPGKDRLWADSGPAKLYGDNGPTLTTPEGTLTCATGPGAADSLTGGPGVDLLQGGDGNDSLIGNDGDDDLRGEAGDDTLLPGAGNDNADGGANNDSISYSDRTGTDMTIDLRAGKTTGATGTTERDTLVGGETIVGGPGNDALWAAATGSQLDGGYGNDTLNGGVGSDLLIGGEGTDTLLGGDGADLLVGAGGNDRMVGNDGPDIYQGGDGSDTADYSGEAGPLFVALNGQADDGPVASEVKDNVLDTEIVIGSSADDELRAGSAPATLYGGAGDDVLVGPGTLLGEAGKDDLRGSPLGDDLRGGDDADRISDGAGDDKVDGGNGDDVVKAGTGADDYVGGAGKDTVSYAHRTATVTVRLESNTQDGEGDIYRSSGPDCNGARCDDVRADNETIIGGSGDDILAGDGGDQVLIGNAGDDAFNGRGGVDRFDGGDGNDDARDDDFTTSKPDPAGKGDTYIMGAGDDYAGGQNGDEVLDLGDGNDRASITGNGKVTADMGAGNDTVITEQGAHTFVGGTGDDRVDTGSGAKDLDMGTGDDVIIMRGAGYATRALMGEGNDEFDGSNNPGGPDVIDGGPGNDFLIGSFGDDTITDLAGSNLVYAGTGNDTVTTGPGTDEVRGDDGDDTIVDQGNDAKPRTGTVPNQNLWGQNGNDTITLTGPTHPSTYDNITGDAGNDTLTGNGGEQVVLGGADDDTVAGGDGNDRVNGGTGNDTVKGEAGDDKVESGDGNDTLIGGTGADSIAGGTGIDTVSYADRTAPVTVSMGSSSAYGMNDGNSVDDSAMGIPGKRDHLDSAVDHVIGTPFDDTFSVNDLNNAEVAWIEGLGGNDAMVNASSPDRAKFQGGDGADTLIGGTGVDTLEGGNGNDLLVGGAGNDVEKGGAGNDRFDQGSAVDGGDSISGDADTDVVDYSARPTGTAIAFTTDGVANDGAAGEADNIAAGTESHKAPGTVANVPTVTVTPAKTTAQVGETVNLTVTVTGSAGVPTGSIDLVDPNRSKAKAALDGSGKAVIPFRFESAGTIKLTANYLGDDRYRSAASAQISVTVAKVATKTTITPLNSPTKVGDQTRVRVTVEGASGSFKPTGSVTVFEGTTSLQSFGITDGRGDLTLATPLTAGSHELTARWNGDNDSEASTSPATTVLVTADGTAPAPTVAISTAGTVSSETAFTLKATVAPSAGASVPDATVTFTAVGTDPVREARTLGTVAIAAGQPSTPVEASLNVPAGMGGGAWTVTATVTTGDPATQLTTGQGPITVSRPATTTTVASGLNPAQTDDVVTFTATVKRAAGAGIPTGRVTFLDNGAELASAPLDGTGKATLTRALSLGTHQVTARYDGSDLLAASTSPALAQVVKTPAGTTGIATTTALARSGNVVTATVTPATGTAPAGQVRFTLDGTSGNPVDLVSGKATYAIPALSVGDHQLVASFLGSPTHAASASAPLTITVAPTLPGVPGTPLVTAAAKDAATISWTAPTAAGSSPITSYTVTVKADAAGTTVKTVTTGTNATSATVTGLTPGKLYRFTVAATTADGTGSASPLSGFALPPFKTVDAFVDRQYRDFAYRAPTSSELATWRWRVSSGAYAPTSLMLSLSNSSANSKLAYVVRTYYAYFQRVPTQAVLDAYAAKLRSGATVTSISNTWAGSSAFRQKYGSLTNTNFVKRAYLNTLKRYPNSRELLLGLKYLGSTTSKRGAFMLTLSEGSYFKARLKGLTELYSVIRPGMGRVPTSAERTQWETKLRTGTATRTQVLAWSLTTAAYDARV